MSPLAGLAFVSGIGGLAFAVIVANASNTLLSISLLTTYAAANVLVSKLVEAGVLQEMTGYARNRRFQYAPYIALFSDAGPAPEPAA